MCFGAELEDAVGKEADFSADLMGSQRSMDFIGSGAFVHGNGVRNSESYNEYAVRANVSPKQMHESVKPSDLMMSIINNKQHLNHPNLVAAENSAKKELPLLDSNQKPVQLPRLH